MPLDAYVDKVKLEAGLTATANSIRQLSGKTDLIPWGETGFAPALDAINIPAPATMTQTTNSAGGTTITINADTILTDEIIGLINKILLNNVTLLDLSMDSLVSADQLLNNIVAHTASGQTITGTLNPNNVYISNNEPTASDGVDGDLWVVSE